MNWEVILTVLIIGSIIFFKQFGQDIIERTKLYQNGTQKGQKRWEWATTPPYFTPKKILYWIFLSIVMGIYIYLGFQLESIM